MSTDDMLRELIKSRAGDEARILRLETDHNQLRADHNQLRADHSQLRADLHVLEARLDTVYVDALKDVEGRLINAWKASYNMLSQRLTSAELSQLQFIFIDCLSSQDLLNSQ
jgi:hypothetical protein